MMGGTRSLVLLAACSRALQPDILLIIADDVGFNGVGYQSDLPSRGIRTTVGNADPQHGTGRLLPQGNVVATSASSRDFGQQGVRARPAKRCRAAPPRPVAARWSVDPFARPRRPPVGAA